MWCLIRLQEECLVQGHREEEEEGDEAEAPPQPPLITTHTPLRILMPRLMLIPMPPTLTQPTHTPRIPMPRIPTPLIHTPPKIRMLPTIPRTIRKIILKITQKITRRRVTTRLHLLPVVER